MPFTWHNSVTTVTGILMLKFEQIKIPFFFFPIILNHISDTQWPNSDQDLSLRTTALADSMNHDSHKWASCSQFMAQFQFPTFIRSTKVWLCHFQFSQHVHIQANDTQIFNAGNFIDISGQIICAGNFVHTNIQLFTAGSSEIYLKKIPEKKGRLYMTIPYLVATVINLAKVHIKQPNIPMHLFNNYSTKKSAQH